MIGHGAVLCACEALQKGTLCVCVCVCVPFPRFPVGISKLKETREVIPRPPQGSSSLQVLKTFHQVLERLISRLSNPNTINESLLL